MVGVHSGACDCTRIVAKAATEVKDKSGNAALTIYNSTSKRWTRDL